MCVCTSVHEGFAHGVSPLCVVLLSVRADARTAVQYYSGFFVTQKPAFPLCSSALHPPQGVCMRSTPMRSRMQHAPAGWLPSGRPPLPSPPQGGSPAHHPRRRSVRAALRRLPLRFAQTSPASGCPHRPPSSRVECMMRGSGVRALAGWTPVRSLRWLPLRFAQTSPASFAPPAHPASV